ncbi:MAG: glycoside hydrolase family 3 C-terminal domain-containing protein, partial [Panacagrimonas sp.]
TVTQRRALARDVGARSITMLRNENAALPLKPGLRRLCVLGPLSDAAAEMRGPWGAAGEPEGQVSMLAGLRASLPYTDIAHAMGVAIDDTDTAGIDAAVALCDGADALLLCLGERANMSGEAASRAFPELPGQQATLARAAIERARSHGMPVVAILFSGRPLIVPWLNDNVDALLAAWFAGCEAGHAITDVLTGRVSPSGRTPISWPRALGQVPIFFGQRPSGRPMEALDHFTSKYLDVPNDPLYPFGHGLSYGRITYANLRMTTDTLGERDVVEISVDVSNEGGREAEETVFLFTRDKVASVTRPLLELRGFAKIRLEPGRTGTVGMSLAAAELRFLDAELRSVFEPGEVEVLVGPCADRAQLLPATLRLVG